MRDPIWVKVLKNGPKKMCGSQADHITSNFLKAVFHKFSLFHSFEYLDPYGLRQSCNVVMAYCSSNQFTRRVPASLQQKSYVQILSRHFAIAQNVLGRPLKVFLLSLEVLQRERKTGFSFTEAYSEPNDRSKMEVFMKILNDFYPLTIFEKKLHLNV